MKTAEQYYTDQYGYPPETGKEIIRLMQDYGDYVAGHLKAKKPPASEYQSCLEVYNDFIISQTGLPAKINGAEGNAMKQIIAYLHRAVTKQDDPDKIPKALSYIFASWNKIEPFLQQKLKLTEINSNLINIISQIKNGTSITRPKSFEQKLADNLRQGGFDPSKLSGGVK